MAWQTNGTPDTLTVAGNNMNIPDLTAKPFNVVLNHAIQGSGNIRARTTINNDGTNLYANNRATNGLANQTVGSQPDWYYGTNLNVETTYFTMTYLLGIAGEEKLMISWYVNIRVAGAGTAPERVEFVGKYVPSPDATINRIDENTEINDYAIDSNKSALGTD